MGKASLILIAAIMLAQFANATVIITDANVKASDNGDVTVFVECYDETGNLTSGLVDVTVYDGENFVCNQSKLVMPSGSKQVECNKETTIATLDPGTYCAIFGAKNQNYSTFFIVPKKSVPLTVDDNNIVTILPLVLTVLFIAGQTRKINKP